MATFHIPLPQSGFPKRLTLSILKVALIIFKSLETKTRVPFAPGDTWKQSTLLMYNGVLGSWPVSSRKLTARHYPCLTAKCLLIVFSQFPMINSHPTGDF